MNLETWLRNLGIKRRVLTIHLPPPPEYKFVQVGIMGLVIYEN